VHPKIPFKRKLVLASWIIYNIVAPFIVYKGTIRQDVIIGIHACPGQWTGKTLVEKFQIIIVNIVIGIQIGNKGNYSLIVAETGILAPQNIFLYQGLHIIAIDLGKSFVQKNGQIGLPCYP